MHPFLKKCFGIVMTLIMAMSLGMTAFAANPGVDTVFTGLEKIEEDEIPYRGNTVTVDGRTYVKLAMDPKDCVVVKQAGFAVVWTDPNVPASEQAAFAAKIADYAKKHGDGSLGHVDFIFASENSCTVFGPNGGTYYFNYVINGKAYVLIPAPCGDKKVSHVDFLTMKTSTYAVKGATKQVRVAMGSLAPDYGTDTTFTFLLKQGTKVVSTGTAAVASPNTPVAITFDQKVAPGTYTLEEVAKGSGWTTSIGTVTVTVSNTGTVKFNGYCSLAVVNTYDKQPEKFTVTGVTKKAVVAEDSQSPDLTGGKTFTFDLYAGSSVVSVGTATVTATDVAVNVSFSQKVTAGTYTLKERDPGQYWSKAGDLIIQVAQDGSITFGSSGTQSGNLVNEYNKPIPRYCITGLTKSTVLAEGSLPFDFGDGKPFTFLLKDGDALVSTGTVTFTGWAAGASVIFDTKVKAGSYTLTEAPAGDYWSSSLTKGVAVTVSESGEVKFDGKTTLAVVNTYDKQPEQFTVTGVTKKAVVAEDSQSPDLTGGKTFTFDLYAGSSVVSVGTATVTTTDVAVNVAFSQKVTAGTYTLKERDPGQYWSKAGDLIIHVAQDGSITFGSSGTQSGDLVNEYNKPIPRYEIAGLTKSTALAEGSLPFAFGDGKPFTFLLKDGDALVSTGTVTFTGWAAEAPVIFDTKVKAGSYTLTEAPAGDYWNSSLTKGVAVTVSESGEVKFDGKTTLAVVNTYDKQPERFTVTGAFKDVIVEKGSLSLNFGKGIPFTFDLMKDGVSVSVGTATVTAVDKKTAIVFETPVVAGTYTLTERDPGTYWTKAGDVTVVVAEDGTITFNEMVGEYVLKNCYNRPPIIVPQFPIDGLMKSVKVASSGLHPDFGTGITFIFPLKDESGRTVATGSVTLRSINDKATVVFDEKVPAGIYTLTENFVSNNWSSSMKSVKVVVSDSGKVTFDGADTLQVVNTYDEDEVLGDVKSPGTGDTSSIWALVAALSGVAAVSLGFGIKKKKDME